MREGPLARSLGAELDAYTTVGLKGLYDWSNHFVHFGSNLLFSSLGGFEEDLASNRASVRLLLWGKNFEIPEVSGHDVIQWIGAMEAINLLIGSYLSRWIEAKEQMWGSCDKHD